MQLSNKLKFGLAVMAAGFIAPMAANAQTPSATAKTTTDDGWKFSISPYIWLPTINANFKYSLPPSSSGGGGGGGGSGSGSVFPNVEVGPNDYLANINGALMLAGDMRKGKWSAVTDIVYLSTHNQASGVRSVDFGAGNVVNGSVTGSTDTDFQATVWTLLGGYSVWSSPAGNADILAGFRYSAITTGTTWNLSGTIVGPGGGSATFPATGSIDGNVDLWDGVIGVRGRVRFGESKWSMPYYLDVGAGSSTTTWQAMAGIAYSYGWGDIELAYRHLSYTDDGLVQDLNLGGFLLGASFRF